jgi:hypothetical protein
VTDEEKVKEKYPGAEFTATYRGPAIVDMGHPGWMHIGSGDNETEAWADAARKLDGAQ